MMTDQANDEVTRRTVFLAKENDARTARSDEQLLKENEQLAAVRAAFTAAEKKWERNANGGKGKWKDNATRQPIPPQFVSQTEKQTGLDRSLENGRVVNLPDFEDSVSLVLEESAGVVEAEAVATAACDVFDDRTGELLSEVVWQKLQQRNTELLRQSREIAQKLQSVGVDGYCSGPFGMWLFDPVKFYTDPNYGRHAIEQTRFRRCNFIPVIAQQKRRFIVKLLEYWLERHPHARFWTFTSGVRCTVENLRERVQELNRKISRLNAEAFMKEAGASIVFRATETGSLVDENQKENKNNEGKWLYHPHSHCIVELTKGRLSRRKWTELMQNVWAFMDNNWDDGGQISTVRECAKYPMKPTDVTRLSPDETKELMTALHRLHLVQPLGSVKALKESIIEGGQTLTYKRTENGPKLVRVTNWNRHMKKPEREKAEVAFATTSVCLDGEEIDSDGCLEDVMGSDGGATTDRDSGPKAIATLAPGPYFDRVMRPAVLVCAKKFGPAEMREICNLPHVRALVDAALLGYQAGQQLLRSESESPIRVHTYPVTVRAVSDRLDEQRELSGVVAMPLGPSNVEASGIVS